MPVFVAWPPEFAEPGGQPGVLLIQTPVVSLHGLHLAFLCREFVFVEPDGVFLFGNTIRERCDLPSLGRLAFENTHDSKI